MKIHRVGDISTHSSFEVKIKVDLVENVKQIKKKTYQGRKWVDQDKCVQSRGGEQCGGDVNF